MNHMSELTRAQKAYDRAVMALDKAMAREVVAWEKLNRAKEARDRGVMAKVYAAGPGVVTVPFGVVIY